MGFMTGGLPLSLGLVVAIAGLVLKQKAFLSWHIFLIDFILLGLLLLLTGGEVKVLQYTAVTFTHSQTASLTHRW